MTALRAELEQVRPVVNRIIGWQQAREESNRITLENERLIDERDSMENRIKLAADTRIMQLEESFEASMTQVRTEAHSQMEVLGVELEQLRPQMHACIGKNVRMGHFLTLKLVNLESKRQGHWPARGSGVVT